MKYFSSQSWNSSENIYVYSEREAAEYTNLPLIGPPQNLPFNED